MTRLSAAAVAAGLSLMVSPGFGIAAADTSPGDAGARPATAGARGDTAGDSAGTVGATRVGRARPAAATVAAGAPNAGPSVVRLRTVHPAAPLEVPVHPAAAVAVTAALAPTVSLLTTTVPAASPTPPKVIAALQSAVPAAAVALPAAAVGAIAVHPPAAAAATGVVLPNLTVALKQAIDRLNNLLGGLPGNPLSSSFEGALALVRRSLSHNTGPTGTPSVPSQPSTAVPGLPITVSMVNSFTTLSGTTAAGTVTVNDHTWVADPTTHLYSTTTDLAAQWQAYYTMMKSGQGALLNDIQRLEGNSEALFENTGLKNLPPEKQAIDRQDAQRQFDAMYAAMVGAGVDLNKPLTPQQYLAVEAVLQGNPTLEELGLQGHGLNNSGITRYAGYTTDFQNNVDQQTLFIGGGLDNNERAIANFFDDVVLSHMPFPTVVRNGVLVQLNQNGNREDTVTDAVAGLNASMARTYLSKDFLQPPQLVTKTPTQAFTNGQALTFALPAGTFVDPQGQTITYTATLAGGKPLPAWITFDPQTAQFSGTPPAGTTPAAVSVTATNASGLHTTETFGVNFKEPAPLLAIPTPTQNVAPGSALRFTLPAGTFVDPLGESLTYTATLSGGAALPSWLTFDPQTGQLSGQAPAGTKSVSVVVVATNSSGVKTSDKFTVKFG